MANISGTITAKGLSIHAKLSSDGNDFISLTDIARYRDETNPNYIIQNWLRNRNTLEFIGIWEKVYNPSFNYGEFATIKSQAGLNRF